MRNLIGLAIFVLFAGCGEKIAKIEVKGLVICDNKPLDGASVAFIGSGSGSFNTAVTDKEGMFKILAVPGKNKVAVNKLNPEATKQLDPEADQTMPSGEDAEKAMKAAPKALVAAKFADPDKSGIVIDVGPNMQAVEKINVTSK
jgi:hypothetical protein